MCPEPTPEMANYDMDMVEEVSASAVPTEETPAQEEEEVSCASQQVIEALH